MANITQTYDKDFYTWLTQNAALLRAGKLDNIDVEHIAEELEGMSRKEKRELISRLAILLMHLLKWKFQSDKRSNSWKYTIEEQRDEVLELLDESPSLKHELNERLDYAYKKGVLLAAAETGLDINAFPQDCPFSLAQVLELNFLPE